jgi:hypothetical protein
MRKIKFRGKSVVYGCWVYGDLISSFGSTFIGETIGNSPDDWCKVDPKTVGQFIGQYDFSGKEIYVGDIIDLSDGYAKVEYNEENAAFEAVFDDGGILGLYSNEKVKVVGNIYGL